MADLTQNRRIQVLREIDKLDKIGIDGVCAMLGTGMKDGSGAFNKGVGLDPLQVGMLRIFLTETSGHSTNEATLASMEQAMRRIGKIGGRIDLMADLEDTVVNASTGETAWDRLLNMPKNADETWRDGGRPANIGWALDDIIEHITAAPLPPAPEVGR